MVKALDIEIHPLLDVDALAVPNARIWTRGKPSCDAIDLRVFLTTLIRIECRLYN